MSLYLYNTATRAKELFEPLHAGEVGIYVCGPTVYDYAHIGNARPVIVFDVLYRLLKRLYPKVKYVRNFTDVDDKINAALSETGEDLPTLTGRFIEIFNDDARRLGALDPDVEPRATHHIPQMVELIEKLIETGHAYEADSHVLFKVASYPAYGQLSGYNREELLAGARVEVASYKRDPGDFVLWKPSTPDLPGWDSPWGRGRPGWHIECSAMSAAYLGDSFDIHGGGRDLIFPHHENEIAQSVCAHDGKPFARYWVHNGFVTVNGEKMSKSLGNFRTVHELLDQHHPEVIRYNMLATHYRQPLDWTDEGLVQAKQSLDHLYNALWLLRDVRADAATAENRCQAALEDDLNAPRAFSVLHEMAGEANKSDSAPRRSMLKAQIESGSALLGILQEAPEIWRRGPAKTDATVISVAAIEKMIAARQDCRKTRDFAEADRIRAELESSGIILEDGPAGTDWRRAG